jgi:hypothetical protein
VARSEAAAFGQGQGRSPLGLYRSPTRPGRGGHPQRVIRTLVPHRRRADDDPGRKRRDTADDVTFWPRVNARGFVTSGVPFGCLDVFSGGGELTSDTRRWHPALAVSLYRSDSTRSESA